MEILILFRSLVISCIHTVEFQILINGGISGKFRPQQGVRQGDPMSHFIFILCMEVLTWMFSKMENNGRLNGIKIGRRMPAVTHLFYIDDILVSCRVSASLVQAIKDTFESFGAWSNLQMSPEKSCILFSPSIEHNMRHYIRHLFEVKDMKHGSIYLGNSILFGMKQSKEFGKIKERVQAWLEGW